MNNKKKIKKNSKMHFVIKNKQIDIVMKNKNNVAFEKD